MSKYRLNVVNGVLVREKRALILWWRWLFNRSEEDRFNKWKNELTAAKAAQVRLIRQLKKEEQRLKDAKDRIRSFKDHGGDNALPTWRDSFSWRKDPVVLVEDHKLARSKRQREPPKPSSKGVIAELKLPGHK